MPNHWHFVLWPETDDAVERFVGWLSLTHAKRFHRWHGTRGPVYPERYEAVPVEADTNLYRVIRYVERNPCAARLVVDAGCMALVQRRARLADPAVGVAGSRVRPTGRTYVETAIETAELAATSELS